MSQADAPQSVPVAAEPEVATTVAPVQAEAPQPAPVAAKGDVKATVMPEEAEPQNALTQKFTEAEWTALKEFRGSLRLALDEAYTDSEIKPTSINLWGVDLTPGGPKNAKASVVLMKFLRARNLDNKEATEMLVNTLRWRKEIKIDEVMKEEFPQDVFGNLGHIYGKDKGGRPVTYNLYGGNQDLQSVFKDTQRFIRWRVALMEKGVQHLDFETVDQMVQVHDYEGVGLSSRTPESKAAAAEASNIFQSHYPEMLYKKYFVNVPTFMSWIFWLFKPLLSAQTIAKMSVVGKGSHAIGKELSVIISEPELPKRYGGQAEAF